MNGESKRGRVVTRGSAGMENGGDLGTKFGKTSRVVTGRA